MEKMKKLRKLLSGGEKKCCRDGKCGMCSHCKGKK